MKRKQLIALPVVEKLPNAKSLIEKAKFSNWSHGGFYSSEIDESTGEKILIISLYNKEGEFYERHFFDQTKWFAQSKEGKCCQRQLMPGRYYSYYDFRPVDNGLDNKIIYQHFKGNKIIKDGFYHNIKGIKFAQIFQEQIIENQKKRARENLKKRTEKELAELKKPPRRFFNWIRKEASAEWKYLFIEPAKNKTSKTKTGYCACCGKKVEVPKVKIGEAVKCPNCKTLCTAKSAATYLKLGAIEHHKDVSFVQPLPYNRFCAREFTLVSMTSFYKNNDKSLTAKTDFREFEFGRWFYFFDKHGGLFMEKGYIPSNDYRIGDWRKSEWDKETAALIYPYNLNELFRAAPGFNLWHIDYEQYAKKLGKLEPHDLYEGPRQFCCIDNLFKAGLYNLVRDCFFRPQAAALQINRQYGSLKKALGLGKDEIKTLSKVNPNIDMLRLYKLYKESGRGFSLKDFEEYCIFSESIKAHVGFFEQIIKNSSLYKFNQYVKAQAAVLDKNQLAIFANDYSDYLTAIDELKYDKRDYNVLFPKDFKKAHDSITEIVSDIRFKKNELPQIAEQYKMYNSVFYYENNAFLVSLPTRHADLNREGRRLHHCVGTYANRVAKGETIILFIRKKSEPDKSFYTLNLDPKDYHQIQCRGLQNCATTKEVNQFLTEYRQKVLSKLKRSIDLCRKTA